ncbi:hypothetical protein TNCV_3419711 [Trichonephila clavipes]|nr:hypothetical protein TNCV_3419711 [Trichonephila clavipes]
MPHNHTTWPLSIFCIRKIHRLGPESNPQPSVQKASDKTTTPPSRQFKTKRSIINYLRVASKEGCSYRRINDTEPPSYRAPTCHYSPTNRAPISKKGPQRNFDTGPPQN